MVFNELCMHLHHSRVYPDPSGVFVEDPSIQTDAVRSIYAFLAFSILVRASALWTYDLHPIFIKLG